MRLLDRLIRGVLTICVILLCGYILVRTVTIAGENGMFQDSPVLSALYRKLETAGMQIYIPVISYQEDALEASPEQDLADSIGRSLYPAGFWAEREQKQEGREEEYELILAAEARAEEEKKPLDLKQWMEERTEGDQEAEFETLLNRYFSMDAATTIDSSRLNNSLLDLDLTLDTEKEGPQILIYHSHSQEAFSDSREGKVEDTIVGVGEYLTQLLTEKYGYQVMHVTETFDMAGGELDRSKAYDYAREWLEPVLEKHSSIQVLIDLHRDGVPEDRHLVTQINGRPTAQIMFYNGLSHTVSSGDLSYLPNPYIQDNLAFSFQLEYQAALYYPELYRGIYLAGFRYNLHLRPRALLLEAGAQTNTVQEVKNAMEPFADILDRVLQGEK